MSERTHGNRKHGGCVNGKSTILYRRWGSMKSRCYKKSDVGYPNYGGRGIIVCEEWRTSFAAFKKWAEDNGFSPELQLDRKETDGNYAPGNCRWVTVLVQQNNRRNTTKLPGGITIREATKKLGVHPDTIRRRVKGMGLSPERAMSMPKIPNGNARKTFQRV